MFYLPLKIVMVCLFPTIYRGNTQKHYMLYDVHCLLLQGKQASKYLSNWWRASSRLQVPYAYVSTSEFAFFYLDWVNILSPKQNGCHSGDGTFKATFLQWNMLNVIHISLKNIPEGPVDNYPALVQTVAWCPNRRQTIIWSNGDLIYWYLYASLGLNGLLNGLVWLWDPIWTGQWYG